MPLVDALSSIARALKSVKAKWFLFGAQAAVIHGVPRHTEDIDVTVLLAGESAELVRALPRFGLKPRDTDEAFLAATRVIPAVHLDSGWRVDFVLGGPGLEEHFAEAAISHRIGTLRLPVIRAEHLLVLKTLAGRPKDLEDIRGVLRTQGEQLDLGETRRLVSMLETELGDATLTATLEKLIAETPAINAQRAGKPRGRRE